VLPVAKAPGARGIRWWAGCGDRLGSDGEDRPQGGAAPGCGLERFGQLDRAVENGGSRQAIKALKLVKLQLGNLEAWLKARLD
jgi:hypothetical protein